MDVHPPDIPSGTALLDRIVDAAVAVRLQALVKATDACLLEVGGRGRRR